MSEVTPLPPLWSGHEFSPSELEFWTQELAGAAFDLPAAKRDAFVRAACGGSAELEARVRSLLHNAMLPEEGQHSDQLYEPGTVIRDCLLLCRIGKGGTGEVYKAIQIPLRRLVAVKVLHSINSARRAALSREAARMSRLQGGHIVAVYDADFSGGVPCIVMEYVEGATLRDWLQRRHEGDGRPSDDTVESIITQVADALREAHAREYVHGDVKPENILLTAGGYRIKVVDFGLAGLVDQADGGIAGTPGYIAPEILAGAAADRRADIFSLGVVIFELLTGVHPFAGRSDAETLSNTMSKDPCAAVDLPEAYRRVVERALRKEPEARYASIEDLLADFQALRVEDSADENPFLSEWPRPARRWLRRHRLALPLAAASLAWGCVSLALSILTGAACIRVLWIPVEGAGRFEMLYGYAVEPNAALWYVVGTSLVFLAGFGFLHAAHVGLARTPTLRTVGPPDGVPAMERIAQSNRRWFRAITPLAVAVSTCFVLVPELAWRDSNAFGWVQADLAAGFVGTRYTDLIASGKIGNLETVRNLCPGCDVVVAAVHNRSGRFQRPDPALFKLFLFLALSHQIVFTAFLVVVAAKILFFFTLLSRALVGTEPRGVRLEPDLGDRHDHRFGLGRLDNAYYAILLFVSVASVGRLAQAAANIPKGTYFLAAPSVAPLIGQPLTFLSILAMLAVLVLTPMVGFMFLTLRSVDREVATMARHRSLLDQRLTASRRTAESEQLQREISALDDRRAVVARQSLLPTRKPLFWWLIALNAVLLFVIPAALGTATGSRIWRSAGEFVCAACGNSQTLP